jgi:hypothetical protein
MKTLVLGQMPVDATPSTHIPAGQWCFLGMEDKFPEWETAFSFPPSPYSDSQVREQEGLRARNWGLRQIAYIADNYKSKKQLPLGIWEFVLASWAGRAAHTIHDYSLRLDILLSLYGEQELRVPLVQKSPNRIWQDTIEFHYDLLSPHGIHWLFSRLLEYKKVPASWKLVMVPPETDSSYNNTHQSRQPAKPKKIKTWIKDAIQTRIPLPNWLLDSCWNTLFLIPFLLLNRKRKDNTRLFNDVFPDPAEMPAYYTEVFETLLPVSLQNIPDKIRKKRSFFRTFVTDKYFWQDKKLLDMAGYKLGGTRIVTTQHSHNYLLYAKSSALTSDQIRHAFIPWGEFPFFPRTAKPAPHIKLVRNYNKYDHGTSLLYVINCELAVNHTIEDAFWEDIPKNRIFHKLFIENISNEVKADLCIRPYPLSLFCDRFDSAAWIKKTFPELTITQNNLFNNLKHCKLSVLAYPGSPIGEALTLNTPVIMVWDYPLPLLEKAKDILKQMSEVKMYFTDPLEAAVHINTIWHDIDSWWNSKSVQDVRNEYLKINIGVPCRSPLRKWISSIQSL